MRNITPERCLFAVAALLSPSVAWSAPWDDPRVIATGVAARAGSAWIFLGDGEWGDMALAMKLEPTLATDPSAVQLGPLLRSALATELGARSQPEQAWWMLKPGAGAALGDLVPANAGGDAEPGLLSLRSAARLAAYGHGLEVVLEPELGLDAIVGVQPGLAPRQAWGGWRGDHLLVGFGLRDRWIGPGRRGALLLSDNASAPPMGTAALQGAIPRLERLGHWRFESSWGWLQLPRDDVDNPGLMMMDLRWLPVPWIELGATRLGLFGGAGRPMPGLLELLVPTEPHVYDDPDKEEPDQNEQASLDFRLTLPLARWVGGPVDYLEGWWQYGAEDIIAREALGLPYPSLAGVANLWGLEASSGPWVLSYEGAHIMDDYFRWYVSHRVYHQGFTQGGRTLGHHMGGDAWSTWLRIGWYPLPWGADLAYEQVQRVGVVEAIETNLLALATDERRRGLSARVWRLGAEGGRWGVGYVLQRVEGEGFIPGADGWEQRLSVSWQGGPLDPAR